MKPYVVIAGAGISAEPPSNLPSWWEYNKKLIAQIKAGALELCPEAADILECIDVENKLPVQCISQLVVSQGAGESYFPLLELLNGTIPNANHYALAELAWQGALNAVVTTNFDTLIEAAFRSKAVPLYTAVQKQDYYEAANVAECKLFKIHGSVHNDASLIDTVRQKAVGLSSEKRLILENVLSGGDIFVIGFSGADLDFDLDYIPLARALEGGSKLTWIIRPGSAPNPNVAELQRRHPKNVSVREMELPELFESLGVCNENLQKTSPDATVPENETKLAQKIKELFSSPYIGPHGCVGYCLTLLEMIGACEAAENLAKIYEEKLDWSALNVFSIPGVNALAKQKLYSRDWPGAIHGYNAVIQCQLHLDKLNRELRESAKGAISPELCRKQDMESAQNLAATYLNLGNVYYYMAALEQADALGDAKKYMELAQSQLMQEPDIPYHSVISFGLARVEYRLDGDYDRYLDALHISQVYAQKEGRLDTLAEILLAECETRMRIGEYPLAWNSLELSRNMLKNVGRTALAQKWEMLDQEYRLRTGEQEELLTEEMLQALMSGVEETVRKAVILFEARRETERLAPLFRQLGVKYIAEGAWQRLWDVAQCCYAAACTEPQRSDALYMLGCAAMEQARYQQAEHSFGQIVDMGKGVNDLKLGWAHSELARLLLRKDDIPQAERHFEECLQVLLGLGDLEQLTQAATNYVAALFHSSHPEQAERAAERLLAVIDDTNAAHFREYLECLRYANGQDADGDISSQPPHIIATQALRQYDAGGTKQAWKWMRLARKKYEKVGNLDGVGRCENNMGTWCEREGDYKGAVQHLKAALDIKVSLGDVGGEINQLSALLQLFTVPLEDFEKAEELAHCAEQHMPRYTDKMERYTLYYGLSCYKLATGDYASALTYGQMAKEGLPYLSMVHPDGAENLRQMIDWLKKSFACQTTPADRSEFEAQALEAERLSRSGKIDECLTMVEQLKRTWSGDRMKEGILEGTRGNAYLNAGRYTEAVGCYQSAIEDFESVTEDEKEAAAERRLTAVNGISIALGRLGREDEAIALSRQELERTEMSPASRCTLTVSLCNRLITLHQDTLQKDDSVFTEICGMLESLATLDSLGHEARGHVSCVYGALYTVLHDKKSAKYSYQQAKKEFLIVNSRHLAEVELALAILED